jgi:excisionase family DNA binding protein
MRVVHDSNLITPGEVAKTFNVDPKTVARWSKAGKFTEYRTPGGHRRYDIEEVEAYLKPKAVRPAPEPEPAL